jgi:hypothetical protein
MRTYGLGFLILISLLPSCAQVGNEGSTASGVAQDEGYVRGTIRNVKAKSVRIEVINEIERDGELQSDQSATQKGVKAESTPKVDAQ